MSADANVNRVAGGYKATMSNPHTSTEAKHHAAEKLEELGQPQAGTTTTTSTHHHTTGTAGMSDASEHDHRVLGGYKATLNNPNTSEEAKQHAKEILEASGYSVEMPAGSTEDEHTTRVLAGYKAALHNDRISAEAKKHAREVLEANNAL